MKTSAWFFDHFTIDQLIAPGATSLVFSGRRKSAQLQTTWRVALKFVWDTALAAEEAGRLVNLEAHKGVVNLIDYFVVGRDVLDTYLSDAALADPAHLSLLRRPGLDRAECLGVLVMQHLKGRPLVMHTTALKTKPMNHPGRRSLLVKDLQSGQWMVQKLSYPLTIKAKFRLLEQVVEYVAECHQNGVVHADLHPQNILYDPSHDRVTIMDLGGNATSGCPGWQAPEHLSGRQDYGRAVDIFMVGLLIHRLFESETLPEIAPIVEGCLHDDASRRATAEKVLAQLVRLRRTCFLTWRERHLGKLVAILVLAGSIWSLANYLNRGVPTLNDVYGADDGAAYVAKTLSSTLPRAQKQAAFHLLLGQADTWPALRQSLVRGLAEAARDQPRLLTFHPSDMPRLAAFQYHQGNAWLLFDGYDHCLKVGDWVSANHYFEGMLYAETTGFQAVFRNVAGDTENVDLPPLDFMYQLFNSGSLLMMYDARLSDLFSLLCRETGWSLVRPEANHSRVRGYLRYDHPVEALEVLPGNTGQIREGHTITMVPEDRDFMIWNWSYVSCRDQEMGVFVSEVLKKLGLEWGEGRHLLDGITISATDKDVMWEAFLNETALRPHGLRSFVRDKRFYVVPLSDVSAPTKGE